MQSRVLIRIKDWFIYSIVYNYKEKSVLTDTLGAIWRSKWKENYFYYYYV